MAGQSVTFDIPVTAPASGTPAGPNSATVSLLAGSGLTDNNAANDTAQVTYSWISATADVSASKQLLVNGSSTTTAAYGQAAVFRIGISNSASSDFAVPANGTQVVDTLPAGWAIGSMPTGCSLSGSTVTCVNQAQIAKGGSVTFDIPVTTPAFSSGSNNCGTTDTAGANTATASLLFASGLTEANAANDAVTLNYTCAAAGADIAATKQFRFNNASATSVGYNQPAVFRIGIKNNGPFTVPTSGAKVEDTIPTGWTIGTLPAGCTQPNSDQLVRCVNQAQITSGNTVTFDIPVTAPGSASSGTNTATVTLTAANLTDSNSGNDTASVPYAATTANADIYVSSKTKAKASGSGLLANGDNITNTIIVKNNSTSNAYATGTITVTDTLSGDEAYVSGGDANWSCSASGTPAVITCTNSAPVGGYAPNATLPTLTITTKANLSTQGYYQLTNTACAGKAADATYTLDTVGNDCKSASLSTSNVNASVTLVKTATTTNADKTLDSSEDTLTYTITATVNSLTGGTAIPTLTIADTVPTTMYGTFASLNATTGVTASVVGAGGGESCTVTGNSVSCTLKNVSTASARSVTISVSRPMFSGNNLQNTATASSPDAFITGTLSATETVSVQPRTDIAVSKSANPTTTKAGTTVLFTVQVDVNGPDGASNLKVLDAFDTARFSYIAGSATITPNPNSRSCSVQTMNEATGDVDFDNVTGLQCDLGTINQDAPGTRKTINIQYQAQAKYPYPDAFNATYTNKVRVKTDTVETSYADNKATAQVTIQAPSLDLTITKTDLVDPVDWDDSVAPTIQYRITATNSNSSPSTATTVKVIDIPKPATGYTMTYASSSLNAGLSSYSPSGGVTCTPTANGGGGGTQYVTCAFADLPPNKSVVIDINFTLGTTSGPMTRATTFANVAKICSAEGGADAVTENGDPVSCTPSPNYDSVSSNNRISEPTTVLPKTDLTVVSKSAVQTGTNTTITQTTINQVFDYVLQVRNIGPATAYLATITDSLPTNMVVAGTITVTPSGGNTLSNGSTCTGAIGAASVSCNIGPLPVDSGNAGTWDTAIRIPVKINPATFTGPYNTNITNTACATPATDPSDATRKVSRDPTSGNNCASTNIQVPVKAKLAGKVFIGTVLSGNPTDGNGIQSVTLTMTGTAGLANGVTRTTTSGSDGTYSFDNLPPGTWTLAETQPSGYYDGRTFIGTGATGGTTGTAKATRNIASGSSDSVTSIALASNDNATGYNFEEYVPVTLSGVVWHDANNNGTKDGGETTTFAGAVIKVSGTDYLGNALSAANITTPGNGTYSFSLPPTDNAGGYTLTEVTEPASTIDGKDYDGSAVISGSAGRAAGSDTIAVPTSALVPGATLANRNFGELKSASIAGYSYLDTNANAAKDAGETTGIPGVTITLSGSNDLGAIAPVQVQTDNTGAYSFTGLRPGTYTVTETAPSGMTNTGAQVGSGSNGTKTGSGVSPQSVSTITIASADTLINYNFGHNGTTALSGYVYVDLNNNGTMDAGEPGISGVAVTISGNAGAGGSVCNYTNSTFTSCTVTTDSTGKFQYLGLPGSDATGYTFTEKDGSNNPSAILANFIDGTDAAGDKGGTAGNDVITGIVISTGQIGSGYTFGERGTTLSGRVYLDADNSGTYNTGDSGISGVTLTLSGTSGSGANVCGSVLAASNCTLTTQSDGTFSFAGLPAGTYALTETQPVDYADRTNAAGSAGGTVASGTSITGIALTTAASGTNYLFGEKAGSIMGYVYVDANNDGTKQGGETPISGVTVTITGTSASGGTPCGQVSCTAVTQADGSYTLSGLRNAGAGGYTITETQPGAYLDGKTTKGTENGGACSSGCVDTVTNVISAIPLTISKTYANFNFGEVLAASIAGRVWNDATNNNSTYESGEEIAGVTLTLTGNDDRNAAVNLTTTTATDGTYSLTGLRPSSGTGYTVTETQPNGIGDYPGNTGTQIGTIGGTATGAAAQNAISGIVLPSGGNGINYNFRESASSLAGYVYVDINDNGVKDAGEQPIPGTTITLTGTDANGAPVNRTQSTANDGSYLFAGLTNGTYTLTETQPSAYNDGRETAGSVGGTVNNSSFDTTPGRNAISAIALPAATAGTGYNFADVVPPVTDSSVSGRVYIDANNNGVIDTGEQGIANITITLSGTTATGVTVSRTVQTSTDGTYTFSNVPPSDTKGYTIAELQPAGYGDGKTTIAAGNSGQSSSPKPVAGGGSDAITGVILNAGWVRVDYNFGERTPGGSISGFVYADANNDGIKNDGEAGIAGVTVKLSGTDAKGAAVNLSTTTGDDGGYSFLNLEVSNDAGYTITETQPGAFVDGKTTIATGNPGTAISAKPVVAGAADTIAGVAMKTVVKLENYNFGERSGAITGYVYVDANDNGVKDAGEDGIAGVTITLNGTDGAGKAVKLAVTSGADGSYAFLNVPASNDAGYTITETQPVTHTDGKTTVAAGNPGKTGANKPVGSGGADTITGVTVKGTAKQDNYNFGERLPGTISGFVYIDKNDNGVRDSGEDGIAGVTVRLTGTSATGKAVSLSTATTADGGYSFVNLDPANDAGYTITESQPSTYGDGKTTIAAGNPGTAVSKKPVAGGADDVISGVAFKGGAGLQNYNFGEKPQSGSITGFVYYDKNDNGAMEAGEDGIANVKVRLTGNDTGGVAVSMVTTTAADGSFTFSNVPLSGNGGYTITETQPPRYEDGKTTVPAGIPGTANSKKPAGVGNDDRIVGVTLGANVSLKGYLFGERLVASLKPPILNGYVWLDRDHSRNRPVDGSLEGMPGWTVQLKQNGQLICTVHTGGDGFYQFDNLHCPGYEFSGLPTGKGFSVIFSKDGTNLPAVPQSGGNRGDVPPTGGQINNISMELGDEVIEQNLPLDPAGVVYDALTRKAIPGASVTISGPAGFDPVTHLVGGEAAHTQVVGSDGLYQFLLQNDFPSGVYTLSVTAPSGYLPAPSSLIPPCKAVNVVGLVPTPGLVQASDFPPAASVPLHDPNACVGMVPGGAATTQYYFNFNITNGGSAPILNNHIPLDPVPVGTLMVTKTTPKVFVARGDLVPYTITATNTQSAGMNGVTVRDQLPPGFKYRAGSARSNGVALEPVVSGRLLNWPNQNFAGKEKKTYTLVLAVGTGVGEGDYVNQAYAVNGTTDSQLSNVANATVRVSPDATFDCPDIIGKVFDDRNANGYQDDGEPGIPSVRIATPRGLLVTTDADGRFHVPCSELPNMDRGSNFVMKLDDRTLPSGYRLTTENPRDVRVTRGKMVKLNFGATIHRVVRLEVADAAFEAGKEALRPEWNKQIDTMIEQLKAKPSVVRIAYLRAGEPQELADKRVAALRDEIRKRWSHLDGMYPLAIEIEGAK